MNIQILNNDLTQHGIVAGFESMEFTRAFSSRGSFRVKINANNSTAKYIEIDKILYVDEDKVGYIDKVTVDKKSASDSEYIIAEGVEIKDRLSRVIYPDSSLESDSYTNEYLETVVKSLINKNAGSLAATERQIPNLTTAADQNRGLQIDYSARYKDLSSQVYSLLKSQEMGLVVCIDFDNGDIVVDVAIGNDLKATDGQAGGIVLSLGTKTALEIVDIDDKLSYKNLSVTAGLGEGASRTINEVYTSASEPAGYARREVFTDARDIESDDELATRGAQKLSEISKTRALSVRANTLGSYKVGDDYDLGDYISVDAKGELYHAQVIKLKYYYAKDSIPQVDLALNFDTDDTLLADISAKHMDYDALLSHESSSKFLVGEAVVGAAVSSYTFTGLDIIADGGIYEIEIDRKDCNYATKIRVNGLTSNNYITSMAYIDSARTSSGSVTPSGYFYLNTNQWFIGTNLGLTDGLENITLSLLNEYPKMNAHSGHVKSGAARMYITSGRLNSAQSNITSITFLVDVGTFGIGTTFKIYKRK